MEIRSSALFLLVILSFLFPSCRSSFYTKDEWIEILETGIIKNLEEFTDGEDVQFFYDFDPPKYKGLLEIADGIPTLDKNSDFENAKILMEFLSPRMKHTPVLKEEAGSTAEDYYRYSVLGKNGINCRAKSQIFNELALANGIHSRKVWLISESVYDNECHVVNEIWDGKLNKWIMLDVTNSSYWVDEYGNLLSVLEIRKKAGNREFITPVVTGDNLENLEKTLKKNYQLYLYILKNLAYIEAFSVQSNGEEGEVYLLKPKNLSGLKNDFKIVSPSAFTRSP